MRSPVAPVLAAFDEPVRTGESRVAVRRLDLPESGLEVGAARTPAGEPVELPEGSEALVIVLDGHGLLRSPGGGEEVAAHTAVWLPRNSDGRLYASQSGMYCLTVRPRTSGVPAPAPTAAEPSAGGEPACLLRQVCAECGRMATESDARFCTRCGAALSD